LIAFLLIYTSKRPVIVPFTATPPRTFLQHPRKNHGLFGSLS